MNWDDPIYKSTLLNNALSYEDFCKIKNHIKMPNNDTMTLMKMIESSVSTTLKPSSSLWIDEMLRKYMGRFNFKHRIPNKPAKEGIKWFILCCSDSQMPFKFQFHDNTLSKEGALSKIEAMVYNMVRTCTNDHVFVDNYFTTHCLFKELLAVNVTLVGTMRTNNIPSAVALKASEFKKATKRRQIDGITFI